MARNSGNAPSEPSGRRRTPSEGESRLREHFRESIRDALSGVDVDELQGQPAPPPQVSRAPSDVTLLTREALSELEAELAALRAERAELERRAAERASGGGGAPAVAVAPAVVEAPAARRESRLPWRRGRASVEVEAAPAPTEGNGNGTPAAAPGVGWSLRRAMEPVGDEAQATAAPPAPEAASVASANGSAAPDPPPSAPAQAAAAATARPHGITAPEAAPPPGPTAQTAPRPKRRRPPAAARLSDTELESVVAPLLAELANLRDEVHQLRGDPEADIGPARPPSARQLAKLAVGLLIGFALIVAALAVVLKA